jgi:serine phosphatase RsbU (regulator of sigma subunit)/pSer/pThr/pTyr-binding forkhead associated (FHA) protein
MSSPFVLKGIVDGESSIWTLAPGTHRVGRGTDNEIRLPDRSVSRDHAQLVVADGIEVRDLGSRNGTWVNGERVEGSARLSHGDTVRFGSVELSLAAAGEAARAPATAPLDLSEGHQLNTTMRLAWEDAKKEAPDTSPLDRGLFQALTEAGQLLVLPRPLEQTLETVLDLVERVVPTKRIMILLNEGDAAEPTLRAARPARSSAGERLMLSRTLIRAVIAERTSLLVTDAQSDPRFREHASIVELKVRSALVAPLFDNERVIGLIYADTTDPRVRYDHDQLRAFTALANLVAVKITNARLLEDQRQMERIEQELATAASIQRSLLPAELPCDAGYEVVARHITCTEVGGDLYDVARLADGRVLLIVGDVTGKGMGAALLMSHVTASLRILYGEQIDLKTLIGRVHEQLLRTSDSMRFVTLFAGILDPREHTLAYVNAGHNPPLLVRPDGEVVRLEATGTPLGLIAGATYDAGRVDLPSDALLCVYSDGITEAARGEEFYDEERLVESLLRHRDRAIDDAATGVLGDVRAFIGDASLSDDATLLLLRRRAG